MSRFIREHQRKSPRLQTWDYSWPGHYFVTICTRNRMNYFGEIRNGIMGLNEMGCVAHKQWVKTKRIRDNVELDDFTVMPNHVHGIIVITTPPVGTQHCVPT